MRRKSKETQSSADVSRLFISVKGIYVLIFMFHARQLKRDSRNEK